MWRPWEDSRNNRFAGGNISDISGSESNDAIEDGDHNRRTHYNVQTQQIILNVYNNFKSENCGTKTEIIIRTGKFTGVSYETVHKIVQNGVLQRKTRKDKGESKEISVCNFDVVRGEIYRFYKRNEVPTLRTLCNSLKNTNRLQCCITTLSSAMKRNGFKYCVVDKRRTIMESARLLLLRDEYLTKMKAYREEKRFICYLDETWYDTHDTIKNGWDDSTGMCSINVPVSRGKRIIIAHAGSMDGWVGEALLSAKNIKSSSLDYHEDMTSSLFEDWFVKKLLSALPPKSVIVMDEYMYFFNLCVLIF
ncbi:charged multivesicular body protein [Holotrichia oblita]|uniref:Charged multivesicular body protein n=1 Tax=Holotrichia oblita TaxID=644536 RepID=A0ACB9SU31_HOLOL|nr:charged multivesicular body protein [Holotrichia oblita]